MRPLDAKEIVVVYKREIGLENVRKLLETRKQNILGNHTNQRCMNADYSAIPDICPSSDVSSAHALKFV